MEIHLDPVGGVAGDMFIAALLDAFPHLEIGVRDSIERVLAGRVVCRLLPCQDQTIRGARFAIEAAEPAGHSGHDDHGHASWAAIRARIEAANLAADVREQAIGIFAVLAQAESRVHGIEAEAVTFHEVGAADSIADIVGAAHIIAALPEARWSVGPLPLGSGRIRTAHGIMPVPAPATALLLEGFATIDDGIAGERVTPTGAAILSWLGGAGEGRGEIRVLAGSGIGFGSKLLPGISNCLRVLVFDEAKPLPSDHREIAVIEFEVDDQSAEDLALGLERLRALRPVFDVVQMPAFGKKGRMMTHVQVLASVADLNAVIAACFHETTTIGLRHRIVHGATLPRQIHPVEVEGRLLRVKSVERGGGRTAKTEADDIAGADGQFERARLREAAERRVLAADAREPAASGNGD